MARTESFDLGHAIAAGVVLGALSGVVDAVWARATSPRLVPVVIIRRDVVYRELIWRDAPPDGARQARRSSAERRRARRKRRPA